MQRCRSLALIFALYGALSGSAEARGRSAASGSAKKHTAHVTRSRGKSSKRQRKRPPAPPPMPSRLEVTAIEPNSGTVRVELLGPTRPPEPRLFVLADDRGRRFVPAIAECTSNEAPAVEKPEPVGENQPQVQIHWQCRLTLAPIYRRAVLTGVSMEWGDRVVSALPGQVRARWAAGPTSSTSASPAPSPTAEKPEKPSPEATSPAPASALDHDSESPGSGEDDEETEDE
jgi:hypothetical protein